MNIKKQFKKEGITKALLDSINIKEIYGKVQLMPNEEPVNVIPNSKGFWISVDGELLKNGNSYIVVSKKEVRIGRARYLLNFKDEILDDKIRKEETKLKKMTDENLKEV